MDLYIFTISFFYFLFSMIILILILSLNKKYAYNIIYEMYQKIILKYEVLILNYICFIKIINEI